jgi:hypothetical protein
VNENGKEDKEIVPFRVGHCLCVFYVALLLSIPQEAAFVFDLSCHPSPNRVPGEAVFCSLGWEGGGPDVALAVFASHVLSPPFQHGCSSINAKPQPCIQPV